MTARIEGIKYSIPVTANDSSDITMSPRSRSGEILKGARAILVGTAGNVKFTTVDGATDTLYLAAGVWHSLEVKKVFSTGTTATDIHVGW